MPLAVDAVVMSNERLTEYYNIIKLAAPAIAADCLPGQFVMVKRNFDTDLLLRRPFSIFEILQDDHGRIEGFSLLNKRVGIVTSTLFALQPGERLNCLGPLGHPFSFVDPPTEAWMVAGGVGLAPFATLAKRLRQLDTTTTLFYGGQSTSDVFHLDFFDRLSVRIVITTEDGSQGEAGLVTGPVERELQTLPLDTRLMIYACGPTGMMSAVAGLGDRYNRSTEVSLEPVMGCGLGGCYSCVVRLKCGDGSWQFVRSCLDGPVFDADRIAWKELT